MVVLARQVVRGLRWVDDLFDLASPISTGLLALGLVAFGVLALDRRVPFQILEVYPAAARPGEQVQIVAKVRRDLDRNCASDMSRYVFDSRGMRWDEPTRHFSAETIEVLAGSQPDMLRLSVMVPFDAHPGPGKVVSDLEYRCNITHAAWPIRVTAVMPFTILPRQ